MTAKSGPVGGAATLSSMRVQKAFSINFRENKRLSSEIKLLESEHTRSVRLVKQEIKETRIWLDKVRESTGRDENGWNPFDDDVTSRCSRRTSRGTRRRKGKINNEQGEEFENPAIQRPGLQPLPEELPVDSRGSIDFGADLDFAANAEGLAATEADAERARTERQRRQSALTTYQRRRQLQSMVVKQRHPLDVKKELSRAANERVNAKVRGYMRHLAETLRMDSAPPGGAIDLSTIVAGDAAASLIPAPVVI